MDSLDVPDSSLAANLSALPAVHRGDGKACESILDPWNQDRGEQSAMEADKRREPSR
jgi:hypothetical protein